MRITKGQKAHITLPVEVKGVDKEKGTLEAIFSTQDIDRHGDTVLQEGWDITNFKKNPVILNSHNYGDATEVIGKASNVRVEKKKLQGDITFAVAENPKAKVIFDLYAGGFLSAFSVGFIPTKFKENKDGSRDWYTIEEAELLEVSAVSVPANARALAKAKGIDVDALPDAEETPTEPEPETEAEPEEKGPTDEDIKKEEEAEPETEEPKEEEEAEAEPEAEEKTYDDDDDEDDDFEDEEDDDEPLEPIGRSYKKQVADALEKIDREQRESIRKAGVIVSKLLAGDADGKKVDEKIRAQIRKRQINQAIRQLLKAK